MAEQSYGTKLLLDGRAELLRKLAALALPEKRAEADKIVAAIFSLDDDIAVMFTEKSPGRGDYSQVNEMWKAIVDWLGRTQRAATLQQISDELRRGRFRGWDSEKSIKRDRMLIGVKRCVLAYTNGNAKQKPKLKKHNGRVGLPDWANERFTG